MKGIIFEIKNKKAIALDDEGRFVKLKNKGYAVGEEIELGRESKQANYRKIATVAAAILIVIILSAGGIFGGIYYNTNVKTAYTVQMDINPSVTIYLNSKDVVIKAEGNNADGAALNPNDMKGETIDGFITKYIERFVESDFYQAEDEYMVKIVVDGKTKKTADTKAISVKAENIVRDDFEDKGISITTETENGVKKTEEKTPSPTTWTYSYYNKLASDTPLGSEKLYDGDVISNPQDLPVSSDGDYTFAFWWDGETKVDSGMPTDFFAVGDKKITADTDLYAVWRFKDGYTTDGNTWLIAPTKWAYSYYNKLVSNNALGTEKLYDGDIITKPSDSPSAGESGYAFAFWWDGVTKEDSGMPTDFFAVGDKKITADTDLYAVWKTDPGGFTCDGKRWLVLPEKVNVQFVLIYPVEAMKTDEILSKGYVASFDILKSKAPSADTVNEKLKLANSDYLFAYWSLTEDGSTGDYLGTKKDIVENIVLYAILKK